MNILAIGHSWVVDNFKNMLRYLASFPDVCLTVVVPDYWDESNQIVYAHHSRDDNFKLLIKSPLTHRQHSHVYPTIPFILRSTKPDILFMLEEPNSLITATTLLLAQYICPKTKGYFYTFLNDDRIFSDMPGLRKWLFPWCFDVSSQLSSGAVCASNDAKKQMQLRGYRKDTEVIPFGTDIPLVLENNININLFRKIIMGEGNYLVGFVGRVSPGKGVELLIKAIAALPARENVILAIIGDGENLDNIKSLARDLEIEKQVRYFGTVSHQDVIEYMRTLDVLVVPSHRHGNWIEQFGRVVVEGMAACIPVIGSDSGEIPNVMGGCGIIFRENDWQDLSKQLDIIRNLNDQERHKMITEAYEHVLNTYDYRAISKKYYNYFMSGL